MGHELATSGKTVEGSPVRLFANQVTWAAWLEKNHHKSRGLWLRLAKRGSAVRSVSYSED